MKSIKKIEECYGHFICMYTHYFHKQGFTLDNRLETMFCIHTCLYLSLLILIIEIPDLMNGNSVSGVRVVK